MESEGLKGLKKEAVGQSVTNVNKQNLATGHGFESCYVLARLLTD